MNVLERVLQYEYFGKGFIIGIHWEGFCYGNTLEKVLLERVLHPPKKKPKAKQNKKNNNK